MTVTVDSKPQGQVPAPLTDEGLIDYCARPACRREFRRAPGPGRRQAYCSEICRRSAEKEYRQTAARLVHFEVVVEQLRVDVAAFGRSLSLGDDSPDARLSEVRRRGEDAVIRAGGVLAFLTDSEEALAIELKALHNAVAPLISPAR